jgi:hypothetical protein
MELGLVGSIRRMGPMRLFVAGGDDLFFVYVCGWWYFKGASARTKQGLVRWRADVWLVEMALDRCDNA